METLIRRSIQVGLLAGLLFAFETGLDAKGWDPNRPCRDRQHQPPGLTKRCPPPAPTSDPAPSAPFLQVIDANQTVVGTVVSVEGSFPMVGFKQNGVSFVLGVSTNALFGSGMAFFAASDCSGPAYVVRSLSPLATTAVDHIGRTLVEDQSAPVASVPIAGVVFSGTCMAFSPFPFDVVPALVMFAPDTFRAPFQLVR